MPLGPEVSPGIGPGAQHFNLELQVLGSNTLGLGRGNSPLTHIVFQPLSSRRLACLVCFLGSFLDGWFHMCREDLLQAAEFSSPAPK